MDYNFIQGWAINYEDSRDLLIGDMRTLIDVVPEAPKLDTEYMLSDQKRDNRFRMFCTAVAPFTAIMSIYNIEVNKDMLLSLFKYAEENGNPKYVAWEGNWTVNGCNVARKFAEKERSNIDVLQFRSELVDPSMTELMRKNYLVVKTYVGNAQYNKDFMDDGILDDVYFGDSTYGHCDCITITKPDYYTTIGNYVDHLGERNVYDIPIENMHQLIANKVYYKNAYVFVPTNWIDTELTKKEILYYNALLKLNSLTWNEIDGKPTRKKLQNLLHEVSEEVRFLKSYM